MKLTKVNKHTIEAAFFLSTTAAAALGLYFVGKSFFTLHKVNKALDIYISEHKYRVAEYECMQDLCADEEK